jgi:hypothetical protein
LDFIGEDRWRLRREPGTIMEFARDEEGVVTGYHIGEHWEYRLGPDPCLPSAEEIAARVAEVHLLGPTA